MRVTGLFGSLVCLFILPPSGYADNLSRTVSLDFKAAPLAEVLKQLSETAQLRILAETGEDVPRVTQKFTNATLEEVLTAIGKTTNMHWEEVSGAIVFHRETAQGPKDRLHEEVMSSVRSLISLLESTSAQQHELMSPQGWLLGGEYLLDVKELPDAQRELVRRAPIPLMSFTPLMDEKNWKQILQQSDAVAFGFLFDPYVEITPPGAPSPKRYFIRMGSRLLDYQRVKRDETGKALYPTVK